jgi:hypothetical protein
MRNRRVTCQHDAHQYWRRWRRPTHWQANAGTDRSSCGLKPVHGLTKVYRVTILLFFLHIVVHKCKCNLVQTRGLRQICPNTASNFDSFFKTRIFCAARWTMAVRCFFPMELTKPIPFTRVDVPVFFVHSCVQLYSLGIMFSSTTQACHSP